MSDVFISYAAEDIENARGIALQIEASGWSVFFDRRIPVGKTWDDIVESELEAARCVVVLWSRHSVASAWVRAEAEDAAARGILIPVLLEEVKIPLRFRTLQAAHWATNAVDLSAHRDQLMDAIAGIVGAPPRFRQEITSAPPSDNAGSSSRQVPPDFSNASAEPSGYPPFPSPPSARSLDKTEEISSLIFPAELQAAVRRFLPDFRLPDNTDLVADWADHINFRSLYPLMCEGRFTRDDIGEQAFFVISLKQLSYKVVLLTETEEGQPQMVELESCEGRPVGQYLKTVDPGRHSVSPIIWKNEDRKTLKLLLQGIELGSFESASRIFFWNVEENRFDIQWMTD